MATITSPRPQSPASSIRVQSPSGSYTPTSGTSARPSLDLNARAPSPAPAAQRRNRAALRDYYNLKSKPGASPQLGRNASVSSTTSTATATTTPVSESLTAPLDAPDFDVEAYVSELSQNADLKTVLRTEAVLISEIRNLDGERKALVYDNYSKLIAATRTIGELVDGKEEKGLGIGGMGRAGGGGGGGGAAALKEMGRLGESVEAVKRMAEGLGGGSASGNLEDRNRRRMEKSMRDTVRWVLGAPEKLKGMVEDGKRQEAEKEWSTVSAVLDQWKGVKGVEETRRACQGALHVEEREASGTG